MINPMLEGKPHEQLSRLAIEQQRHVLEFACASAARRVHGVPGRELLRLAGPVNAEDFVTLAQAIREG